MHGTVRFLLLVLALGGCGGTAKTGDQKDGATAGDAGPLGDGATHTDGGQRLDGALADGVNDAAPTDAAPSPDSKAPADLSNADLTPPLDLATAPDLTPADTTPPAVVSVTPTAGLTVGPNPQIVIVFSEPMTPLSTSAQLTNTNTGTLQTLSAASWNAAGDTLSYTAAAALTSSTGFTVVVRGADSAGNPLSPYSFQFSTGLSVDPPVVSHVSPADGAVDVPLTTKLSVTFDRPMDTTQAPFVIVTPAMPTPCPSYVWTNVVTYGCTSTVKLANNAAYHVFIGNGVSAAGTAMTASVTTTFHSVALPTVVVSPADATRGVDLRQPISFTFNQPVASVVVTVTAGGTLTGSLSSPSPVLSHWTPAAGIFYPDDTVITWSVTFNDLATPPDSQTKSGTFRTSKLVAAVLSASTQAVVSQGGTPDTSTTTLLLAGTDATGKEVRSYLSFGLSGLPAGSQTVYSAVLDVVEQEQQGSPGAPVAQGIFLLGGFGNSTNDFRPPLQGAAAPLVVAAAHRNNQFDYQADVTASVEMDRSAGHLSSQLMLSAPASGTNQAWDWESISPPVTVPQLSVKVSVPN